jgi:hypothetical protein
MSNITIATIISIIAENRAAMEARHEKHVEKHGAPVRDKDGRYHAPHDGYMWGEQTYLGGQYLPEDDDYREPARETLKIKVLTSALPALELYGSAGKSWTDNKGREVCYCYLNVTNGEQAQIEPQLPASGKRLVSVEAFGNPDNVKTWKHSTPKMMASYDRTYGFGQDILDFKLAELCVDIRYDETMKTKNKWKAFDYAGNLLDGKPVRYEYLDDLIA